MAKEWDDYSGDRFNRRSKILLREDLERMRSGELGLSEAEIEQRALQAAQAAGAQVQAQQNAMAQQALATSGAGRGAFKAQSMKAMQGLNDATADAAAQATTEAHNFSRQLAESQRQAILARLSQQVQRTQQNTQAWAKYGQDTAKLGTDAAATMGGGAMMMA